MTRTDSSLPSRSVYCESPLSSPGPRSAALSLVLLAPAGALAATGTGEDTPLNLPADGGGQEDHGRRPAAARSCAPSSAWPSSLAVIYGVAWVLKQVKRSKEERGQGTSLETTAVVALGPNRSLHLVRAGRELVLVGVAEHGVTPIRTYTEDEAIDLGLIGEDDATLDGAPQRDGLPRRRRALAGPPQGPDGAAMKGPDGTNAVQLLLLVGGADAHPRAALLRHRLHAHPHRPGLHPPGPGHAERAAQPGARRHRPLPDDLRHGADLHADQEGRHRPAAEAQDHAGAGLRARPGAAARVHVPPDARRRTWRCS